MNNTKQHIAEKDIAKAKAIISRIARKDKAGIDYVYTIGIDKEYNFLNNIIKNCDKSTVLLVSSGKSSLESKEDISGIIFLGENGYPIICSNIKDSKNHKMYLLEDFKQKHQNLKWCIGEIRTAKSEDARALETESLLQGLLLSFYI